MNATDKPDRFLQLPAAKRHGWRIRILALQRIYRKGLAELDRSAPRHDFVTLDAATQDRLLAEQRFRAFRSILFGHAVEGMYSHPIYGGNAAGAIWRDIGYDEPNQTSGTEKALPLVRPMASEVAGNLTILVQMSLDGFGE